MFLLSAPRQQLARLPLAVVGFTAFGVLTAFAFDESARPELDFGKIAICAVDRRRRARPDRPARAAVPRSAPRSALTGARPGLADRGVGRRRRRRREPQRRALRDRHPGGHHRCPLRADRAAGGRTAPAHRAEGRGRGSSSRRRMRLCSPAWSIPLISTIYQSFRNRDNSRVRRAGQLPADLRRPELVQPRQLGRLLHQPAVLHRPRHGRCRRSSPASCRAARRARGSRRGEVSMLPDILGFFLLACAVLSTVRGTIFNNLWWVIVVTTLSTAIGPRRRRARRPIQGRERSPSR